MYCCEFGSAKLTFLWLSDKESTCQCRRPGFDPWMGKIPGGVNDNPPQYSYVGNPMDTAACGLQSKGSQGVGHT